jgi:hypothetical protein
MEDESAKGNCKIRVGAETNRETEGTDYSHAATEKMKHANRAHQSNRPRGVFCLAARGVPMTLLQAKKLLRGQGDVVDCDAELLEIFQMGDFIGLAELPEELRQMTASKLPTYWRLYRKAVDGDIPVYRVAGRLFVQRKDLPTIIEKLGLKINA